MKNYYAILDLKDGDSLQKIKKAYKEMVKKWHPDFHPDDPQCLEKIKDINEAYEVLSHSKKRRAYHQQVKTQGMDYYRQMAYAAQEYHPFFAYFLRFQRMFMKRVLLICTRNSSRSQMAEALINHDLAGQFEAFSAGTEPSFVNPLAIAVMKELGMDISNQRSKGLDEFDGQKFDYVITLCSQADEACPVFFGGTKKIHMGFPDPTATTGSEEEKITAFRRIRDQIRERVVKFLLQEIQ